MRPLLLTNDLSMGGGQVALLGLARAMQRLGLAPLVAPVTGGVFEAPFREAGIELSTQINLANI